MALNMSAMMEATRLTKAGRLSEAMVVISGALGRTSNAETRTTARTPSSLKLLPLAGRRSEVDPSSKLNRPVSTPPILHDPGIRSALDRGRPASSSLVDCPAGATFAEHVHRGSAGVRHYKLYVPANRSPDAAPLVVMLHGCTQSPDDFAAGTRMNELAEEFGFLVAYPAQPQTANPSKCWNWFSPKDQQRGSGEPSLIAGIVSDVVASQNVDASRVYVAGLSAGGAAAAIMGATYPEMFAAIGVHSGLACGAANGVPAAFRAMKQGNRGLRLPKPVPAIVFHGDRDQTVAMANGEQVVAQALSGAQHRTEVSRGRSGKRDFTRTVYVNGRGTSALEHWVLHGAGHAWSGGCENGSFTDKNGPDASREMVRFFLTHRL